MAQSEKQRLCISQHTIPALIVKFDDGIPLPVEPLWTLDSAAQLIPMSVSYLKRWLRAHRSDPEIGPPLYTGSPGRRYRLLRSSEIRYIRSKVVSNQFRLPEWGRSGSGKSVRKRQQT